MRKILIIILVIGSMLVSGCVKSSDTFNKENATNNKENATNNKENASNYRSGFGAERDSIELELINN